MTRDYRRSGATRPSSKRQQRRSCVWWFLFGGMLGGFGASLYWIKHPEPTVVPGDARPAHEQRPVPVQPDFQFPKILRDTEVEVDTGMPVPAPTPAPRPQPPASPQPSKPAPTPSASTPVPAASSGSYVVQAGSFKRSSDAERLRAELGLLGITSRIETATLPGGQIYHRVRTGPYASKQQAEEVRALLKRNGKDGLTLPAK